MAPSSASLASADLKLSLLTSAESARDVKNPSSETSNSFLTSGSLLQRSSHTLSLLRMERREKLSRSSQWRHKSSSCKLGAEPSTTTHPTLPMLLPLPSTSSTTTAIHAGAAAVDAVPLEWIFREAVRSGRLEARSRSLEEILPHLGDPLTDLVCVDLASNKLTSFPTFLLEQRRHGASRLQSVLLANNRFERLPDLGRLADSLIALSLLDLSGNRLVKVPLELFFLPRLQVLLLGRNRIAALPTAPSPFGADGIHCYSTLHELDLSHNRLVGAVPSAICKFSELRVLNIGHNQLNELPEDLPSALPSLVRLDLSCNELTRIPSSYFSLFAANGARRRIELFDVRQNPLISPSMSVVRRGMGRIAKWLQDAHRNDRQSQPQPSSTNPSLEEPSIVVCRPRLPTSSSGTQTTASSLSSGEEKVEDRGSTDSAEQQKPIRGSDSGYASNVDDQQQQRERQSTAATTREEVKAARLLKPPERDMVVSKASNSNGKLTAVKAARNSSSRIVAPKAPTIGQYRSSGVNSRSVIEKLHREGSLPTTASTASTKVMNRAGGKSIGSSEAGARSIVGMGEGKALSRSQRTNDDIRTGAAARVAKAESVSKLKPLPTLNGGRSKATTASPTSPAVKHMCALLEAKCKNGRALSLKLPSEPRKLAAALANGVILCEFINAVRPNSVYEVLFPRAGVPLPPTKARKNVEGFLAGCKLLCGTNEAELCSLDNILEGKNLQKLAELVANLDKSSRAVNGSPNEAIDK